MALSADVVNTSPRQSVIDIVEECVDEKLSDMDWVADNRRFDSQGREYWSVEVAHRRITEIEVETLAERYKAAGWDELMYQQYYGEQFNIVLYKPLPT